MLPNFWPRAKTNFCTGRRGYSNFYEFSFEAIFFLIRRRWSMARRLNGFCAFTSPETSLITCYLDLRWLALFSRPLGPFCSARSCGSLNFRRRPRKTRVVEFLWIELELILTEPFKLLTTRLARVQRDKLRPVAAIISILRDVSTSIRCTN